MDVSFFTVSVKWTKLALNNHFIITFLQSLLTKLLDVLTPDLAKSHSCDILVCKNNCVALKGASTELMPSFLPNFIAIEHL